ncbi:hypothetical protein Tco_0151885 [Tanacetum coccineum]
MFVSVLTDKYLSYGESTSCRVESQHALVKKYLGSAQSNLDTLLSSIDKIIIGQETAIKESFNKSKSVRKHRFKIPQFSFLVDHVSHLALDKILKELQRPNNEECGCQLRTSYGLPCAHELLYYHNNDVMWPVTPKDGASCEVEMRNFKNVFEKASPFFKKNYLTKLKAITTPESVSIREPAVHHMPHITTMYNVIGDGNCGFRSVAIGIGQSENTWPEIRQNLLQDRQKMDYVEVTQQQITALDNVGHTLQEVTANLNGKLISFE